MSFLRRLVVVLVACLAAVATYAHSYEFKAGALYYDIISDSEATCMVRPVVDPANPEHKYAGDVVIPTHVSYDGRVYTVIAIERYAFEDCSELTSVKMPDTIMEIGEYAFKGCTALASIEIPDLVEAIVLGTFAGCKSLASVKIPDSVWEVGPYAFSGCEALQTVALSGGSEKLVSIKEWAFRDCTSLTSIEFPYLLDIGAEAFAGCTSLSSVMLPAWVNQLSRHAFDGRYLTELWTSWGDIPPCIYDDSFASPELITLYVPMGTIDAYRDESPWMYFKDIRQYTSDGIVPIEAYSPISVMTAGGNIHINGAEPGTTVSLYTVDGILLETRTADDGGATFSHIPIPGRTYIIRCADTSMTIKIIK